ncbi:nucleosome assembly protein 1,4 [Tanacetum coccineum]
MDLPLDNGIRAMLTGCNKLERLDIHLFHGGLTDVGLGYIGKYGRNLVYLSLKCIGESDAGLVELSKGCPKLRKLKLKSCPFSEQAVATLLYNICSLRYISVLIRHRTVLALTRPTVPAEVILLKAILIIRYRFESLVLTRVVPHKENKRSWLITIGSVTSILGEENLNISSMSVGSTTQRKQAVMVIGVDGKPSNEALKKIDEIPAIKEFVFLVL